jgi:hypothetical protein
MGASKLAFISARISSSDDDQYLIETRHDFLKNKTLMTIINISIYECYTDDSSNIIG